MLNILQAIVLVLCISMFQMSGANAQPSQEQGAHQSQGLKAFKGKTVQQLVRESTNPDDPCICKCVCDSKLYDYPSPGIHTITLQELYTQVLCPYMCELACPNIFDEDGYQRLVSTSCEKYVWPQGSSAQSSSSAGSSATLGAAGER